MSTRIMSLAGCVCLAAMAASGQTSYVFQLPGVNGLSTQITGLGDNDFNRFLSNANGLAGAYQVLATPAGDKFFVVSPGGIQSAPANTTLSPLTTISGISGTITSAGITPDGKYLLVVADHFYIINTLTNAVVQIDAGIPGGSAPVGFAVSRDSQTAYVLANVTSGSALGSVSLSTFQTSPFLFMPYSASSVTLSPLGLLYVTFAGDQLYEIDPGTLSVTPAGHIELPGLSGPMHFTPDGTAAYSVNRNVCSTCFSLFKLNVAVHTVTSWPLPDPNNPPPVFDDIFVASASQIYAFSSAFPTTKLWDVAPSPLSAAASALGAFPNGPGLPINNIFAVAMSNERPSARFLYLIISDSRIMRVNVGQSNIDSQTSIGLQNGTTLSFTPIPAQSGAASFFTLNRTLTVAPGATSAPLIAQVVDSVGRPVVNVPVCFSTDPSNGVVINAASQITNADGWVQSTITAPTAGGTYTVTLSAGAGCPATGNLMSTAYTITVAAGGGGNGNAQISIYTGNGQLLRQQNSTTQTQPLTVKLTDPTGLPVAGALVTFAVTQGLGFVSPVDSSSDENGLFRANFITTVLNQGLPQSFVATTINASSAFGSVDFIETTHNALDGDAGQPSARLLVPDSLSLTIAQGDTISAGIVAQTISGHAPDSGQPIPNIGIRLADPNNRANPSTVLSCQGSTLGDATGLSRCNVVAACQPPGTDLSSLPPFIVWAEIGEYVGHPITVNITQGKPSQISIVSGNNQIGNPSSSFTLLAKVTDGCGQNFNGQAVTWVVTQGANSSLSQVQSVSSGNGTVSARLTLGSTPGPIQVTVSAPGLTPVVFNLTNQVAVSGLSPVLPLPVPVVVNQTFTPLTFVARDGNGNPVPGLLINFAVTGNAIANPTSATTNGQGQVQTTITAGSTAGNIVVTATYNNALTGTATLSAQPPGPQINNTSFTNAASSTLVGMVPCGLITAIGSGIAPAISGVVTPLLNFGPLPFTLAGVSITVQQNGLAIPAPIQAVANIGGVQQVNFQAPCELTAGAATVAVTANGATTTVQSVPVFVVQPGLFVSAVSPTGKSYGYVISEADGSIVTSANPAHRGQKYFVYVTGLGQATPTIVTNTTGTGQNVNLPLIIGLHDGGVTVLSARYLAGSIGAYLVEFQIPLDAVQGPDQALAVAAIINGGVDGFFDYKFGNPLFLPAVD
jgi:uncharacterized protein (TIGR03437 family)